MDTYATLLNGANTFPQFLTIQSYILPQKLGKFISGQIHPYVPVAHPIMEELPFPHFSPNQSYISTSKTANFPVLRRIAYRCTLYNGRASVSPLFTNSIIYIHLKTGEVRVPVLCKIAYRCTFNNGIAFAYNFLSIQSYVLKLL